MFASKASSSWVVGCTPSASLARASVSDTICQGAAALAFPPPCHVSANGSSCTWGTWGLLVGACLFKPDQDYLYLNVQNL